VIWCTGFRQEFSFIHPPVTGEDGWPRDEGGVVPSSPGLYFMGLLFQRGFYSMLNGGAGRDANHIARHIVTRAPSTASA
jgi:putative flavoprotein involved in K+ transport